MARKEKLLRVYDSDINLSIEYREPLFFAKEKTGADEKIDVNKTLFVDNFRKFSNAILYCTEHGSNSMRTMIMNEYIAQTNIDEKLAKAYIGTLNLPANFRGLPLCTIENVSNTPGKKYILFWYQDTPFGNALKQYWHGDVDLPQLNIIDEHSVVSSEDPDIRLMVCM